MEEVIHHFEHLLGFLFTKLKKNKKKQNNETKKRSFFVPGLMPSKGHVISIVAESFHLTANKGNKPQSPSIARLAYEIRGTEKK